MLHLQSKKSRIYVLEKLTPMPIYSSDDSDTNGAAPPAKLFGRQRPIHAALGGGTLADVLLWRNRKVSGAILASVGLVWFLFEVAEYSFVTLVCHISITAMLACFIWSRASDFFGWSGPNIPKLKLHEHDFQKVASTLRARMNHLLSRLIYIACGRDLPYFFLAIFCLYILSVVGNYFNFLNLVFLGIVSMETVPFVYEMYEEEVDRFAGRMARKMKRKYHRFSSDFLNKIPREDHRKQKK